jgi:hypothetical protein
MNLTSDGFTADSQWLWHFQIVVPRTTRSCRRVDLPGSTCGSPMVTHRPSPVTARFRVHARDLDGVHQERAHRATFSAGPHPNRRVRPAAVNTQNPSTWRGCYLCLGRDQDLGRLLPRERQHIIAEFGDGVGGVQWARKRGHLVGDTVESSAGHRDLGLDDEHLRR